jgi:AMMECR1 domain-containing protein
MTLTIPVMLTAFFLITCSPCQAWDEAGLLQLARDAVRSEVLGKKPPQPHANERALPVFVTIERRGQVLGCRGSLQPRESSLQREVIQAARAAARHDPRYRPLSPADLQEFLVTVTIIEKTVPLAIATVDTLRPEDGLVLQSGGRFGIVLPWEGKVPRQRLIWAYRKAGVSEGASCRLFLLKAQRFRG